MIVITMNNNEMNNDNNDNKPAARVSIRAWP